MNSLRSKTKEHCIAADMEPSKKRAKIFSVLPKPVLNRIDCNLDLNIHLEGLSANDLNKDGFAYCWSGARGNIGITGGRYCFGCTIIKNQDVQMEDIPKDQQNLCRVGFSRGDDEVGSLGESLHSFGYGGTGKFSSNAVFQDYGEPFGVGDTIICAVDLECQSMAKITFAKNGKSLGVAKEFDPGENGLDINGALGYVRALFPHVLLKNVKVRMLFSPDHGLMPLEGYKPWDSATADENALEGPRIVDTKDCEVMMMVGLPGCGKTTWAQKWAEEHPEKRYMQLGTNVVLDQMKVPGLLKKRNYGERFDRLMGLASQIFNKLLEMASKIPRNYILDQTNVYHSARIRKLKPFKSFRKIAVVVFPQPEELMRRAHMRAMEMGKEVPEDVVNEMIENYVLPSCTGEPMSEPFNEVRFVELQRNEAEHLLREMKSTVMKKHNIQKSESVESVFMSHNFAHRDSFCTPVQPGPYEPQNILSAMPNSYFPTVFMTNPQTCVAHHSSDIAYINNPVNSYSRQGPIPAYPGNNQGSFAPHQSNQEALITHYDKRPNYGITSPGSLQHSYVMQSSFSCPQGTGGGGGLGYDRHGQNIQQAATARHYSAVDFSFDTSRQMQIPPSGHRGVVMPQATNGAYPPQHTPTNPYSMYNPY